jgi:RsmE family RNA methyltransferase
LVIQKPIDLENLISQPIQGVRFWSDESARNQEPFLGNCLGEVPNSKSSELRVLIGPEGGWSQQERIFLSSKAIPTTPIRVSLGPFVLRAETAALFSISLIAGQFLSRTTVVKGTQLT